MAGEREVKLTLRVTAQGLEVIDQAGQKLRGISTDAGRMGTGVAASLGGLASKFGVLAAGALTLRAAIGGLRSAIDGMENIARLSQITGLAAEEISKLGYSASLAETDLGTLSVGLRFFARNMVEARQGSAEAKGAFAALGVDTSKGLSPALLAASDAFAQMADGEAKTAAAVQLFGRAGSELIPLLNQGSAALKAQGIEAERLGVVVSGSAAKAADEFNDDLTRLGAAGKGLGIDLANTLLPALTHVAERLLYATGKARETNVALGALALFVEQHDFTPPSEIMAEREQQATQRVGQYGGRGEVSLRELRERRQAIEGSAGANAGPDIPRADLALRDIEQRSALLEGETQQLAAQIALKEKLLAQEKGTSDQLAAQHMLVADITNLNSALLTKKEESLRTQTSLALMQGKTTEYESLQAQLANVVLERKQQSVEATMRGVEIDRHAHEVARQQATMAGEAETIAAESAVTVAAQRMAAAQQEGASRATLLGLTQQLDIAEQARLRTQIEGLERMRSVMATMPATPLRESEIAVVTARIEAMNEQLAVAPSHVAKMQSAFLDLGATITATLSDVVKGIALGTGTLEDAGRRMGEALIGTLIEAVIKDKLELDMKLEQNFLYELPQMIGLAGEKIGNTFTKMFSGMSSEATKTADMIGGTFRNVPGVGNIGNIRIESATMSGGRMVMTDEFGQRFSGPEDQAEQLAQVAGGTSSSTQSARTARTGTFAAGAIVGIAAINAAVKGSDEAIASAAGAAVGAAVGALFGSPVIGSLIGSAIAGPIAKFFDKPPRYSDVAVDNTVQAFEKVGLTKFPVWNTGVVPSPDIAEPGRTDTGLGRLLDIASKTAEQHNISAGGGGHGDSSAQVWVRAAMDVVLSQAGLSTETTKNVVRELIRGFAGGQGLDTSLLMLQSARAERARKTLKPNEGVGDWQYDAAMAVTQDDILNVGALLDAYENLGGAIDANRLAVMAFTAEGELQLEVLTRGIEAAKRAASSLNLASVFEAGLAGTGRDFRLALAKNVRTAFTDAITTALADAPATLKSFQNFTALTAQAQEAFRAGDYTSGARLMEDAASSWREAARETQGMWLHLTREAPGIRKLFDDIATLEQGPGFVTAMKDAAEGLREQADQVIMGGLSPGRRRGAITGKIGTIDAELAAMRASAGGIDTRDELTRARELAAKRSGLVGQLEADASSMSDRRRVAALYEETAALFDEVGTAQQAQIDAVLNSTTATVSLTDAITTLTSALTTGAAAGDLNVNVDANVTTTGGFDTAAVTSTLQTAMITLLDDPRIRAKLKQIQATG